MKESIALFSLVIMATLLVIWATIGVMKDFDQTGIQLGAPTAQAAEHSTPKILCEDMVVSHNQGCYTSSINLSRYIMPDGVICIVFSGWGKGGISCYEPRKESEP